MWIICPLYVHSPTFRHSVSYLFFNLGSTISEIGTTLSISNTARLVLEEESLHASMELTKKVLIFLTLFTTTDHMVWNPSTVFGLFALLHVLLSKKKGYASSYFQASIFFMLLSNIFLETLWASKNEYSGELGPQNDSKMEPKIKLREKVKIELSPRRELYFWCPDPPETGLKNHLKNDLETTP